MHANCELKFLQANHEGKGLHVWRREHTGSSTTTVTDNYTTSSSTQTSPNGHRCFTSTTTTTTMTMKRTSGWRQPHYPSASTPTPTQTLPNHIDVSHFLTPTKLTGSSWIHTHRFLFILSYCTIYVLSQKQIVTKENITPGRVCKNV